MPQGPGPDRRISNWSRSVSWRYATGERASSVVDHLETIWAAAGAQPLHPTVDFIRIVWASASTKNVIPPGKGAVLCGVARRPWPGPRRSRSTSPRKARCWSEASLRASARPGRYPCDEIQHIVPHWRNKAHCKRADNRKVPDGRARIDFFRHIIPPRAQARGQDAWNCPDPPPSRSPRR